MFVFLFLLFEDMGFNIDLELECRKSEIYGEMLEGMKVSLSIINVGYIFRSKIIVLKFYFYYI